MDITEVTQVIEQLMKKIEFLQDQLRKKDDLINELTEKLQQNNLEFVINNDLQTFLKILNNARKLGALDENNFEQQTEEII